MELERAAQCMNVLGAFCGMRDVQNLTASEVARHLGAPQADVMVLFGGSILAGGDVLAEAIQRQVAKRYMIVGGEGHTTESLRQRVHQECPQIQTAGLAEAEVFARYLQHRHGETVDLLETSSTNCGNNVTYCLDVLRRNGVEPSNLILVQDASMQRRMDAGFRKHLPPETRIVNYAAYAARVVCRYGALDFAEPILGMWSVDRYLTLLLGEIPRLTDDANGYGPRGKNYIAHVDIPEPVREAFTCLSEQYGDQVRAANPAYASKT